ncbi:isochorismatase family protein [Pseudonocardiaceae bacterium YIM PH 21723]|nr:isochorismatase family protein [Pseudonocardiaceae bacterium YIM PH 21723]
MTGLPTIEPYPMPAEREWPANIANWAVDASRAVLLLHDMQKYFLRPFAEGMSPRDSLVANTVALRERCRELGVPVAYTAQPGSMTQEQRGLLRDFWGPGMKVDPDSRAVIDELTPSAQDWVFTKWRYSAFHNSDLLARMREHGRDQIVLCGVYANIGVLTTAVEAFSHDIETFFVADAVADFSAADHAHALDYAAKHCAVVVGTKQVLRSLFVPSLVIA